MIVYCYDFQTNIKFEVKSIKELCDRLKHYTEIDLNDWPLDSQKKAKKAYYQKVRYHLTKMTNPSYIDTDINDHLIIAALDEYLLMNQVKMKEYWDAKFKENGERIKDELQNKRVL